MVRYINIKKVSFIISKQITKHIGKVITEHIQFFLPVVWLSAIPSKKAITEHIQFFIPYISVIAFSLSIRFINVCNK